MAFAGKPAPTVVHTKHAQKKALPSRQRFFLFNPLFFLSFHYIPQRIQFRLAE